ncbi:MAG: xlyA, partial [Pseudomonas sp.]|nr:xlyA [Pseudomonas sp.]
MTTTYTVQPGDTLGHIAQRFGMGSAELLHLNPFINNPNYVRTGWVLTVPDSVAAAAPEDATPTPEPVAPPVLQLAPIAAPPEHCTINFCGEQKCKRHFTDVIYESGQNRFWLLREHILNTLLAAADDLKKKLLTTDPDSRIKALNDAGLLEPFLEPKASSFLDAPQSQRYLEIELELEKIGQDLRRLGVGEEGLLDVKHVPNLTVEQIRHVNQQQQAAFPLRRELRELDTQGYRIARERGYFFEDGHLYSAEAMKARAIIQRYLRQRQAFVDLGQQHFTPEELAKFDEEYTQIIADIRVDNPRHLTQRRDVELWLAQSKGKLVYAELTKTLLEAAAYGLALPEYALKGDNPDIKHGFTEYEKYHHWLRTKAKLDKGVEASFNHWANVTKQAPPSSLFAQEEDQWRKVEADEATLKKAAEDFVNRSLPRRHLLWNPEQFAPKPQQRLVRTDFPLREISVPTEVERLRHLSLDQVLRDFNKRMQELLKEDLKTALAHAKNPEVKAAAGNVADPDLFSTWLTAHDAHPLEIRDDWFDRHGFFQPELFKRHIKNEKIYIQSMLDHAAFDAWGKDLQQMLFKQSTLGPLRLFDNSPQARLIRCLTPTDSSVQLASQLQTPSVSLKKGLGASANVTLDLNLAQGEINIASFELPARREAKEKLLSYQNENDLPNGIVNVGKFCLTGSLKAWGFAGASMMLSANLRVGPNKNGNDDLGIDTERDVQRRFSRAEPGL